MKTHLTGNLWTGGVLVSVALAFHVAAQGTPGESAPGIASPPSTIGSNSAKLATSAKPPVSGMEEILGMLDAGVSQKVIKAYIESAPVLCQPTGADIIALKQRGITDDLTIAWVKRGAELRAQASQAEAASKAAAGAAVTAFLNRSRHDGPLDPESYEFFQHYYLFPRTLASVHERLGYYPPPY